MGTPLIAYVFRDNHFAPAGDTIVCAAELSTIDAALGLGRVQALFQGAAIYTDDVAKLDYIGVWGARKASRFRTLLRRCGIELLIARTRPPNVRLRYFSHSRRLRKHRRLTRSLPSRDSQVSRQRQ